MAETSSALLAFTVRETESWRKESFHDFFWIPLTELHIRLVRVHVIFFSVGTFDNKIISSVILLVMVRNRRCPAQRCGVDLHPFVLTRQFSCGSLPSILFRSPPRVARFQRIHLVWYSQRQHCVRDRIRFFAKTFSEIISLVGCILGAGFL